MTAVIEGKIIVGKQEGNSTWHQLNDGQTSNWAVHQIAKYKEQKDQPDDPYTRLSWVITSAEYTDDAKSKAQSEGVRLIDRYEFAEMLIDVGLEGINSAFWLRRKMKAALTFIAK